MILGIYTLYTPNILLLTLPSPTAVLPDSFALQLADNLAKKEDFQLKASQHRNGPRESKPKRGD